MWDFGKIINYRYVSTGASCGDYSVATKRGIVKILHFRQFYKHFVFVDDGECGKKKLLKNYADVNVCIDMVCGDTKIDFERED